MWHRTAQSFRLITFVYIWTTIYNTCGKCLWYPDRIIPLYSGLRRFRANQWERLTVLEVTGKGPNFWNIRMGMGFRAFAHPLGFFVYLSFYLPCRIIYKDNNLIKVLTGFKSRTRSHFNNFAKKIRKQQESEKWQIRLSNYEAYKFMYISSVDRK